LNKIFTYLLQAIIAIAILLFISEVFLALFMALRGLMFAVKLQELLVIVFIQRVFILFISIWGLLKLKKYIKQMEMGRISAHLLALTSLIVPFYEGLSLWFLIYPMPNSCEVYYRNASELIIIIVLHFLYIAYSIFAIRVIARIYSKTFLIIFFAVYLIYLYTNAHYFFYFKVWLYNFFERIVL